MSMLLENNIETDVNVDFMKDNVLLETKIKELEFDLE